MRITEAYALVAAHPDLLDVPQFWGARHLLGPSTGPRVVWVPAPERIESPASSRHKFGTGPAGPRSQAAVAVRAAAAALHLQVPAAGGPASWDLMESLLERLVRVLHEVAAGWGNLDVAECRPAESEELHDSLEGYVMGVSFAHPIYRENPATVPLTVAVTPRSA